MELTDYFTSDDGSLPEIEVHFPNVDGVAEGLSYLFALGARDASVGGAWICTTGSNERRPFEGPNDAKLVIAGAAEAFHLVLAHIECAGGLIPGLGVFVFPDQLVLDYRMGPEWGLDEIHALLVVLSGLGGLGGHVLATPWWGAEGNQTLAAALARVNGD